MDNPQAFPSEYDGKNYHHGMTLRDYFAGQALTGLLSNPEIEIDQEKLDVKEQAAKLCTVWCYTLADAMLKAREEK